MKAILFPVIIITGFLGVQTLSAQSYEERFERVQAPKIKTQDPGDNQVFNTYHVNEAISYLDVMNRSTQIVNRHSTPNNNDVVQFSVYNLSGLQTRIYQPYATSDGNGLNVLNPIADQSQFYTTAIKVSHTNYPYSEIKYDGSKDAHIKESSSPGYCWRFLQTGDGNTKKFNYQNNEGGEIRKWTINDDNTVTTSDFYPANTLQTVEQLDENRNLQNGGKHVILYSDFSGKTLLKKEFLNPTRKLLTYYIYDDFGNLRFILPPKTAATIPATGTWNSNSVQSAQNDLVFWFKYDDKQRVIQKKAPGKEPEFFVYDKLNRLLMRQDGNMRSANQWYFYEYDILGRIIDEGIKTDNSISIATIQGELDALSSASFEQKCEITDQTPEGYTDGAYPATTGNLTNTKKYIVNYYDTYPSFIISNQNYSFKTISEFYQDDEVPFLRLTGKVTCTKVRTLETVEHWCTSVIYYDARSRIIQIVKNNHKGGIDVTYNSYNFDGSPRKTRTDHNYFPLQGFTQESIQYRYDYDNGGRLSNIYLRTCCTCPNEAEIVMVNMKYNEIGQLIEKNMHKSAIRTDFLQAIDYAYNPRGWLTKINQADLTNQNTYVQNETNQNDVEIIDGMNIDTIVMKISSFTDKDGVNNLDLTFLDSKSLNGLNLETQAVRSIVADERESQHYVENVAEDAEMFELLIENTDSILIFDLNHLYFDENTDKEELLDSIRNMVYAQLVEKGITNEDFIIKAAGLVRSFISDKVSIVFFNKNNAALFGENIYYETGPNPQCNGNIGSVIWQVNGSSPGQRRYSYQYDGKKQLLSAEYAVREGGSWANSPENGRYDMKGNNSNAGLITYDDNGNILTTLRNGQQTLDAGQGGGPSYGTIDDLVYSYKGNQLDAVTDLENSSSPASMPDFHQKSDSSSGHYGYDANGNLIRDDNKGITSIVYNHLNLPSEINFGTSCKISYIYDATGRKLSKLTDNKVTQHVTDYCGAFVYENNALVMVQTPEGRLMKTTEGYDCQYYLKDHLGNVNVVFHEDRTTKLTTIVQEDQFYPYGMKHGGLSFSSDLENKNLYQGKELQNNAIDLNDDGITDSYLDWYDFDARYFDPQLCRWHVPDPANQHASPYLAMSNNPVSFVDPDGLTDMNHSDGPRWGRRGVDDPDGRGGRLLGESLIGTQSVMWEMEAAAVAMQNKMEGNLASFDNWVANLQIWYYVKEMEQTKNAINRNAKENGTAPEFPNTGGSDEIDPEAELAQAIDNSSHTGLSYNTGGGENGKKLGYGAGASLQITIVPGGGFTGEIGVLFDSDGKIKLFCSFGPATGGEISGTLNVFGLAGPDFCVEKFEGQSFSASGSYALGRVSFGGLTDISSGATRDYLGDNYYGGKVGIGLGYGVSLSVTNTYLFALPSFLGNW